MKNRLKQEILRKTSFWNNILRFFSVPNSDVFDSRNKYLCELFYTW